MYIPQMMNITTLQRNYSRIVKALPGGPVFLSAHARPVAVMLAPGEYERLAAADEEMKRLKRIISSDKEFAEMLAGDFTELLPEVPA